MFKVLLSLVFNLHLSSQTGKHFYIYMKDLLTWIVKTECPHPSPCYSATSNCLLCLPYSPRLSGSLTVSGMVHRDEIDQNGHKSRSSCPFWGFYMLKLEMLWFYMVMEMWFEKESCLPSQSRRRPSIPVIANLKQFSGDKAQTMEMKPKNRCQPRVAILKVEKKIPRLKSKNIIF